MKNGQKGDRVLMNITYTAKPQGAEPRSGNR